MIRQLESCLQTEGITFDKALVQFKRKMEARLGDDWRAIKKTVARKSELQTFVASRRLGKSGLRPFGSRGSISARKSGTGARIRKGQR